MNCVNVVGRVATDLTVKTTSNERVVADFRIAVQRTSDESDFFTVVAWEYQAELAQKYVKKGHRVGITGRLKTRKWKTDNGDNREVVEIVATHISLIETKAETGGDSTPAPAPAHDDFVPA